MKTKVIHCRAGPYDVYIGRPGPWGNPFPIGEHGTRAEVIEKYEAWFLSQPELIKKAKEELRGKTLGCWCKPSACHGDVIAKYIDVNLEF